MSKKQKIVYFIIIVLLVSLCICFSIPPPLPPKVHYQLDTVYIVCSLNDGRLLYYSWNATDALQWAIDYGIDNVFFDSASLIIRSDKNE